jgi:phenylpyruvate tautomerase PptA (4-oxalocrotonate tautomerase family)
MPLVRISLSAASSADRRRAIGTSVHDAMVETIGIPADDRFQVVTEHAEATLVADPHFLGIARCDPVFVHITLRAGRTVEQKKALYARIVALAEERAGVRPADVLIALVENELADWSFGNGVAQYVS